MPDLYLDASPLKIELAGRDLGYDLRVVNGLVLGHRVSSPACPSCGHPLTEVERDTAGYKGNCRECAR